MNQIKECDIAPCGMICSLCHAYLRDKNTCGGCRSKDNIFGYCKKCVIRNCEHITDQTKYCYYCENYPCKRLKALDYRYRTKYNMSFIENLGFIKLHGADNFIKKQNEIWKCADCGELICIHKKCCLKCGEKSGKKR
jgi:hypothetical protein